jgi:hypothetical protein
MPIGEFSITMHSFLGISSFSMALRKGTGSGFPFSESSPVMITSKILERICL